MGDDRSFSWLGRAAAVLRDGLKAGLRALWPRLRAIPVLTLALAVLDQLGLLRWIEGLASPLTRLVGLPGGAALVVLTSILLNLYCAAALLISLHLDLRSATILAMLCLSAHNLIAEIARMRLTRSSRAKLLAQRLMAALVAGFVFNLVLPASPAPLPLSTPGGAAGPGLLGLLASWALSTAWLLAGLGLFILGIHLVQSLLVGLKIPRALARPCGPIMRLFGLPGAAAEPWMVMQLAGFGLGTALVEDRVREGVMKAQEAELVYGHAGLCHSLLEQSLLFLVLGLPLFWITVPRLVLAFFAVWVERARRRLLRRSFRVGTE
jgi:spore maturation protein SpmB